MNLADAVKWLTLIVSILSAIIGIIQLFLPKPTKLFFGVVGEQKTWVDFSAQQKADIFMSAFSVLGYFQNRSSNAASF